MKEAIEADWARADESDRWAWERGIDPGLIAENLAMAPLERMRQHDRCVQQILAVQERLGVTPAHES